MPQKLYEHRPHPHITVNANAVHATEKAAAGFNQKLAITLTVAVGSMACAYVFAVLAILGFPGLHANAQAYVQWISQTFIQLVMLSVIMVGQRLIGRHEEIQSDETYQTTMKTEHNIEQIVMHLEKQDEELIKQTEILSQMMTHIQTMVATLAATDAPPPSG